MSMALRPDTTVLLRIRGTRRHLAGRPHANPARTSAITCGSPWSRARSSTPATSTRTRASPSATDLDFLLHLGDYIYEASNTPPTSQTPGADIGRPFEPLHECVTLDDYRTRYRQYRSDPDVQLLHAAHPVIATLDDHELADGAWRDGAAEHRPEYGTWAERRATAFRAREEWLPVRRVDPTDPSGCGGDVAIGSLRDLFVVDTRTHRDQPTPEPGMSDPDRSALGPRPARVAASRAGRLDGAVADARQPVGDGAHLEPRAARRRPRRASGR